MFFVYLSDQVLKDPDSEERAWCLRKRGMCTQGLEAGEAWGIGAAE